MKHLITKIAVAALLAGGVAAPAVALDHHGGGHSQMQSSQTIVDVAVASPDHTTLVSAVQAAGLGETLSGEGPFTVFAPTNAAFAALPAGTVDTLLKPENKDQLTKVLTAHVVPGKMSGGEILGKVQANGGRYEMTTVSGDTLVAVPSGSGLAITDESGNTGVVTIADVNQSNGVIHVVNGVLVPK